MMRPLSVSKVRKRRITSADVGRYLKHMAAVSRDPLTGNQAMSDALYEISAVLIAGKASPARTVLESHLAQKNFEFEEDLDLSALPLDRVRDVLGRSDLTKADLTIIGTERFGIAKSRMDRISRDEIIKVIMSAVQHEESLAIISEEAQRHSRTS